MSMFGEVFIIAAPPSSSPNFQSQIPNVHSRSSHALSPHTRRSKRQPAAPMLVSRDCPYRGNALGVLLIPNMLVNK
jgi:hypothetical protein